MQEFHAINVLKIIKYILYKQYHKNYVLIKAYCSWWRNSIFFFFFRKLYQTVYGYSVRTDINYRKIVMKTQTCLRKRMKSLVPIMKENYSFRKETLIGNLNSFVNSKDNDKQLHVITREANSNLTENPDVFNTYFYFLSNFGMKQQSKAVSYQMLNYKPVYPK